ncbi:MAG: hypothetical protein AB7R89_19830 [Dehalococcoidia bacterium]
MMGTPSPVTEDEPSSRAGRRLRHRAAYVLIVLLLLFIIVLLPLAITSLVADFRQRDTPNHSIASVAGEPVDRGNVAIDLIGLNEWEGSVTVRVTAYQECDAPCDWRDRYRFVSLWGDDFQPSDRPTMEQVTVPESPPAVTRTFQLPLSGDPLRYPFDRYQLALGVIMDRLYPDGREETLTLAEARNYVTVWVSARIPRIRVEAVGESRSSDPAVDVGTDSQTYLFADVIQFSRPLYLQVLTVFLVLLVAAAAAYAVFLRPLDQLIINAGALILGVWGIRVILIGTSLPGLTALDLALWSVILFLLVTITVRTLWLLEEDSGWRLLRTIVRHRRDEEPPARQK